MDRNQYATTSYSVYFDFKYYWRLLSSIRAEIITIIFEFFTDNPETYRNKVLTFYKHLIWIQQQKERNDKEMLFFYVINGMII